MSCHSLLFFAETNYFRAFMKHLYNFSSTDKKTSAAKEKANIAKNRIKVVASGRFSTIFMRAIYLKNNDHFCRIVGWPLWHPRPATATRK